VATAVISALCSTTGAAGAVACSITGAATGAVSDEGSGGAAGDEVSSAPPGTSAARAQHLPHRDAGGFDEEESREAKRIGSRHWHEAMLSLFQTK
jgi:hypothetical protein